MLTAVTDSKGSAAYVAIEQIRGTLNGKKGSFVVHPAATMSGGANHMSITVVPDSGIEQSAGITGEQVIKIADPQPFYELDYVLF